MEKYAPFLVLGVVVVLALYLKNQGSVGSTTTSYQQPTYVNIAAKDNSNDQTFSQERVARAQIASDAFNSLLQYNAALRGYDSADFSTKKQKQLGTQQAMFAAQAAKYQADSQAQQAQAAANAQIESAKAMASAQKTGSILDLITSSLGGLLSFF